MFQERMDHILERCPGTMGIADDVAMFGKDEKEHDANLHNLTKIAQQEGLVFNPDKCDIKKQKMRFFGLQYNSQSRSTLTLSCHRTAEYKRVPRRRLHVAILALIGMNEDVIDNNLYYNSSVLCFSVPALRQSGRR